MDDAAGVALAHRRLAILDLSPTGHQPLAYGGRYHVVLNGEIYNFLELRRELESEGYVFHTQTDTEIIPAAYDRWGADCQLRFNGMWAFALWDAKDRRLFLSRDRFGIKPLYYTASTDRFVFASELKAFLHLEGFAATPDRDSLRRVLTNPFSLEGTEESLLKGVRRLPAGHCLSVRGDMAFEIHPWWRTMDHLPQVPATAEEQAEKFREIFFDSCRIRLRSDVPVATCLSGGLDSSSVLCTLAELNQRDDGTARVRRAGRWQDAFIVSYPGTPMDERAHAEQAISHVGAQAHVLALSAPPPDEIARAVYDFEDISTTLPWPVWALYRELRRSGNVVSLDGHGADELLGGYPHYAHSALKAGPRAFLAPRRCIETLRTRERMGSADGRLSSWELLRLILTHAPDAVLPRFLDRPSWNRAARRWLKHRGIRWVNSWLQDPLIRDPLPDAATCRFFDDRGPLTEQLYTDFHRTILPSILRNFDRCSMAHGVEVRMPFMDWRLVTYAFALPDQAKWGAGLTKRVLRDAMRGHLPEALRTRKSKMGFNAPLAHWFSGSLREWLLDQVSDRAFVESDLWFGGKAKAFVERKSRSGRWNWREAEQIWLLVHAHLWQQAFSGGRMNVG